MQGKIPKQGPPNIFILFYLFLIIVMSSVGKVTLEM